MNKPKANRKTTRAKHAPAEMDRSRRVGLVREVCQECGAVKHGNDDITTHTLDCTVSTIFIRQRTGSLRNGETSLDKGWVNDTRKGIFV